MTSVADVFATKDLQLPRNFAPRYETIKLESKMKLFRTLLMVLAAMLALSAHAAEKDVNGIPYVQLNDGLWMPRFGIGTFNVPGDSVAADAVRYALQCGYRHTHGYGTGGSASVWCSDFDAFLMKVKRGEATSVHSASVSTVESQTKIYGMDGRQVYAMGAVHGAYVVKSGQASHKVLSRSLSRF